MNSELLFVIGIFIFVACILFVAPHMAWAGCNDIIDGTSANLEVDWTASIICSVLSLIVGMHILKEGVMYPICEEHNMRVYLVLPITLLVLALPAVGLLIFACSRGLEQQATSIEVAKCMRAFFVYTTAVPVGAAISSAIVHKLIK